MPEEFVHADFKWGKLDIADLDRDPFSQFTKWYDEVQKIGVTEYQAMTLATCSSDCRPSARVVYLRNFGADGYLFYTNYLSRKGHELAANPWASVCFFWKEVERQVRIEGRIEKVAAQTSDAYFADRPLDSQLGAWASTQSAPLDSIATLSSRVEDYRRQFAGQPVPRPPHWGGYRLIPDRYEFWQGRPSRLHDRFAFEFDGVTQTWKIVRLNP